MDTVSDPEPDRPWSRRKRALVALLVSSVLSLFMLGFWVQGLATYTYFQWITWDAPTKPAAGRVTVRNGLFHYYVEPDQAERWERLKRGDGSLLEQVAVIAFGTACLLVVWGAGVMVSPATWRRTLPAPAIR